VLSLKGDQGLLHEEVAEYFAWAERINFRGFSSESAKKGKKQNSRLAGLR
jgi:hypothetical protein